MVTNKSIIFVNFFSGTHYHGNVCNSRGAVEDAENILLTAKKFLFPKRLIFLPMASSAKNVELHPENGGWADLRDRELCLNISQSTIMVDNK